VSNPLDVAGNLTSFFNGIRGIFIRFGIGSAGVSLIILGVILIITSSDTVRNVVAGGAESVAGATVQGRAVGAAAKAV